MSLLDPMHLDPDFNRFGGWQVLMVAFGLGACRRRYVNVCTDFESPGRTQGGS
uniref:Uncharacterized protein n=1 Tax=Hyaloperonospora arabidopsidis (strain Emoy2) TaxID=559515 RepID=M4BHX8_HYAAE